MKVHHGIDQFSAKNPVVTIGTFDGVHRGHVKVIDELKAIAKATHGQSVLFTFYPHPRLVVAPDASELRLITTLDEKIEQLEKTGIDHVVIFPFTKEFAKLSYRQFIEEILIGTMGMKTLVVGYDHKLGRNREGSFENIVELSKSIGFDVQKISAFLVDNVDISSSKIRKALQQGNIEMVNSYLGYPFSVRGKVMVGNQIGRSINFPTANVEANDPYKLIPAEGVYAVFVEVKGKIHKGMLNIGHRPTIQINADQRTIEAHIFDFNQNIYQEEITIRFYKRIRDEQKFDGLDALKAQLKKDQENVRGILNSLNLKSIQ